MSKKLYRSSRQNVVAGVCGGLAEYLNTDVTIIRLIWVLAFFLWGAGVLAYIIAAIIIPKEPRAESSKGTVVIDEEGNEIFVPNEQSAGHEDGNRESSGYENASGKNNSLLFVGGAMVVVGGLILMDKFLPLRQYFRHIRGYGWPVLLIIVGVIILISSLRSKN